MTGYTNNTLFSGRVTGLATGLNTEEIVAQMTAFSKKRINDVLKQKELLTWKKEQYRSVISELIEFKNTFFNVTSKTNSLSSNFYLTMQAKPSSDEYSRYIKMTANTDAAIGSQVISGIKLATSTTIESEFPVSKQLEIGFDSSLGSIDLAGKCFHFSIEDNKKTITFDRAYSSIEEFSLDLKSKLDSLFGSDRISISVKGSSIFLDSDGAKLTVSPFETPENDIFSLEGMSIINDSSSRLVMNESLAENNLSNALIGDTFEFEINGKSFLFSSNSSILNIINTINSSDAGVRINYSSITDKFTLTSTKTGCTDMQLNDKTGNLLATLIGSVNQDNYKLGSDAEIIINNKKVVRPTNSFTIDGITYNLLENTDAEMRFDISLDVDKAYENIENFVNSYNKLINSLNSKISEQRFRDYQPLTPEQKNEMTEKEITLWEEKAKSGLLRNDSNISNLLNNLRSALYQSIKSLDSSENLGLSLTQIGITTAGYQSKGKLTIDSEKLRQALTDNPALVNQLFTQKSSQSYSPNLSSEERSLRNAESGLMWRINDLLEDNVRITSGGGILLQVSGYTGSSTESNNQIEDKIREYNKKLVTLESALKREEEKYYLQFTQLEKYIARMNSQSDWLYQQFSNF